MKAKDDNIRNIDRMNKINSNLVKKQYTDHMDQVKHAQSSLVGSNWNKPLLTDPNSYISIHSNPT